MFANLSSRPFRLDAPPLSLCLSRRGDALGLALADGQVALFPADDTADEARYISLYPEGSFLLVPDADDHALLAGGPGGRVFIIDPSFDIPTEIAQAEAPILALAGGIGGYRAYATQDQIVILSPEGEQAGAHPAPHGVYALRFSADGTHWLAASAQGLLVGPVDFSEVPRTLDLPGLAGFVCLPETPTIAALVPAGLVFTEAASSQPPSIPQPLSIGTPLFFEAGPAHRLLLAGGATGAVALALQPAPPFIARTLPLGPTGAGVVGAMAAHPHDPFVAVGYESGLVVLAPLDGRMEVPLRPATAGDPVRGLAWSAYGDCLFVATGSGSLLMYVARTRRGF